jgi:hypothetical protein
VYSGKSGRTLICGLWFGAHVFGHVHLLAPMSLGTYICWHPCLFWYQCLLVRTSFDTHVFGHEHLLAPMSLGTYIFGACFFGSCVAGLKVVKCVLQTEAYLNESVKWHLPVQGRGPFRIQTSPIMSSEARSGSRRVPSCRVRPVQDPDESHHVERGPFRIQTSPIMSSEGGGEACVPDPLL